MNRIDIIFECKGWCNNWDCEFYERYTEQELLKLGNDLPKDFDKNECKHFYVDDHSCFNGNAQNSAIDLWLCGY